MSFNDIATTPERAPTAGSSMRARYLAALMALALLTSGCIGLGDAGDDEDLGSTNAEEMNATDGESIDGPEPIEREFEATALLGVPVYDPGGSTGVKADFAKTSYDHGANGTWLVGYEIQVQEGYGSLEVQTSAEESTPSPDYDLFLYGPDGEVLDQSLSSSSEEEADVEDPEPGTYLAIAYLFTGASAPVTMTVTIR